MYEYIKSLLKFDILKKGEKTLIDNFTKILENGNYADFEIICNDEKISKIIIKNDLFWKNIKFIVSKSKGKGNIINCIRSLYKYDKNYILNQKEKLFDYYPEISLDYIIFLNECNVDLMSIINYLNQKNIKISFNPLVRYLLTLPNGKVIIINNLDYFISFNNRLLELQQLLKSNNINSNIDELINSNEEIIIEEMINNKTGLTLEILKKENLLDDLKKLIDSVLSYENKNYSDIEKIGYGSFSDVYRIGDKVVKIGKQRKKFNIDNNKRFLQPVYRANIKSEIDKRQLLCIEITEVVDTKNVNTENLYQVYKELRDLGYVWVDCRLDNLGRLLKDNKVYFEGNNDNNSVEILKKGDVVILDNDYIYTEQEFQNLDKRNHEKLNNIYNYDLLKNFEKRYQEAKIIKQK